MSDPIKTSLPSKKHSLLRSSVITGSMTMMSRVLGLARDQVLAHHLGAGGAADAFFLAFKIPNFFRRLFSEGAFSQAFVPVLSEYREKGSHEALKHLIDRVAGCLGSALLLITLLVVMGAPVIAAIFAPGFINNPEKFDLLVSLIRITFPYLLLISLTGFAGAILNSYDRFAIPAFTPVFLNICMIAAAVVLAPLFSAPWFALAWSVLLAGVISFVFQLPFLQQLHLLPRPIVDWKDPGVRRILTLMAPAIFGVSISQINVTLDSIIASFLPDGSIGWLFYSDRLVELPLGVFAVAIATVIMPSLSRQHAAESTETFSRTLDWAMRLIVLIALPSTLALVILAEPIILTLFQHGHLTLHDALMSSYSLQAYVMGLLAFMLIKVLAPGYFARQDMKTPVKIGVTAILAGIGIKLIIVAPMNSYWQIGHVGLALSTAAAAYINALLLYRGLRKQGVYQPASNWLGIWLRYGFANALMVACLLIGLHYFTGWHVWGVWPRILHLSILCFAGFSAYMLGLMIAGFRMKDFRAAQ